MMKKNEPEKGASDMNYQQAWMIKKKMIIKLEGTE